MLNVSCVYIKKLPYIVAKKGKLSLENMSAVTLEELFNFGATL